MHRVDPPVSNDQVGGARRACGACSMGRMFIRRRDMRLSLLDRSRLTGVPRKRFRFRPPGLKPGTKVGTLGPYRGRLGLAWVLAPLVIAIIIVVAGAIALFR